MYYSIIGFDIEEYSKDHKAGELQHKRTVLETIIKEAIGNSGLTKLKGQSSNEMLIDTGDGFLALIDSRDYNTIMVFLEQVRIVAKKNTDIRFRGILHQGDCKRVESILTNKSDWLDSANNTIGNGINEAARFLDSEPLKVLLKFKTEENFVFGISRDIFNEILNESYFEKSSFHEYSVSVKEFMDSIYLYSSNQDMPDDDKVRSTKDLTLTEKFQSLLSKSITSDLYSLQDCEGKDIYVFPAFSKEFDEKLGAATIKSKDYLNEYCSIPKNVIISGDEQIGKTSLCKEAFKIFYKTKTLLPIFLALGDSYSGLIKNKIASALRMQYEEGIADLEDYKKILILDDFHLVPARYQRKMLDEIKEMQNTYLFIIVDSVYNINLLEREITQFFESLSIKEFSPSLRYELIGNWMETEEIIDDNYKIIDSLKDFVDNTLLTGLVPSTAFNILVILAERKAFNPLQSEITSKVHCYHTLILLSLKKADVIDTEFDIYSNVLEHLSYYFYDNEKDSISESEYQKFLSEYGNEYNQPIPIKTLIGKLNISNIIYRNSLGEYQFNCKYIYYFFVAKYLADHKEEKRISTIIESIYKNLQINEYGYIGIFLIHHIKDLKILDEIQINLMVSYDKYEEVALSKDEIAFLEKHICSLGKLSISANNRAHEVRKKRLEIEDKHEEDEKNGKEESGDLEVDTEVSELRKALKTAEVMGHILKTRTGSFKKEKQKELFKEALKVYLRITNRFLKDFEENEKLFIEYFKERIRKFNHDKLDSEGIYQLSVKYFFNFNMMNYYTCLLRASSVLCSEQIVNVISEVCDEIGTPMSYFVKRQCQMWYLKKMPVDDIVKDIKDMPDFAKSLMKIIVINYCELHDIDYKDKQRIASKLDISIKKLMVDKN